jgi:hypothetical protein
MSLQQRVTREDLLSEEALAEERQQAAALVADGVLELESVGLDSHLEDGEVLAEGENDAFREAVAAELESVDTDSPDERQLRGEHWRPDEVVFKTIWEEYNFPERVSHTQLSGALEYSDHTSFGDVGVEDAIDHGVETGQLVDIPRTLSERDGREYIEDGLLFARGWSE